MKIVIPGISGGIARRLARKLASKGHDVIGIDPRPWPGAPKSLELHTVDVRKRGAEEVFRRTKPDAVIHMATVSAVMARAEERHRINLGGTRAVFGHCEKYGVKQMVFVGRHTYYGAAADSPLYHTEEEPPQGLDAFPDLADLVAADLYAANALWRNPKMITSVLRLCYTLGPTRHGTLGTFLAGNRVPMVLGYDPLFQFMHEEDAVSAIALAVEKKLSGVYNVAGPQPLPLSVVARESGRTPVMLPEPVIRALIGRFGFPRLSAGALSHIKFPVVIDATRFKRDTGFAHEHDEGETLRMYRDLREIGVS